jgi:hypothetical protein
VVSAIWGIVRVKVLGEEYEIVGTRREPECEIAPKIERPTTGSLSQHHNSMN